MCIRDRFEIEYISKLKAITLLQDSLSVVDQGKDTGMLSITFTDENPADVYKRQIYHHSMILKAIIISGVNETMPIVSQILRVKFLITSAISADSFTPRHER